MKVSGATEKLGNTVVPNYLPDGDIDMKYGDLFKGFLISI